MVSARHWPRRLVLETHLILIRTPERRCDILYRIFLGGEGGGEISDEERQIKIG